MSKGFIKVITGVLLLVMTVFTVSAAPGDLDSTFGEGGVVQSPEAAFNVQDLTVSADGKIYAISVVADENFKSVLLRYEADGSLDTAFGELGIVWLTDYFYALTLDGSGKIIVAGGLENLVIQRFHTDGSPDTDFGTDGSVTASFDGTLGVNRVWTGEQNEILVGGTYSPDDSLIWEYRLLRYTETGDPDNTFGTGGMVNAAAEGKSSYGGNFAVDTDGTIVVILGAEVDSACTITRLLANGSRDTTFGVAGFTTEKFLKGCVSLALTADHQIVVAGARTLPEDVYNRKHGLIRLNSNGSRDSAFGKNGKVKTDLGSSSSITEIAIDAEGRIIAAGHLYYLTEYFMPTQVPPTAAYDFLVLRYLPNGNLDTNFALDGLTTHDTGTADDMLYNVALDMAGNIIVGGNNGAALTILRYQSTGLPRAELLTNPGFEAETGWKLVNKSGDKRECEQTNKQIRATISIKYAPYTGKCAFRFKVKPGENSQLSQKVNGSSITAGSTLTLSAWAKMEGGNTATIKVKVKYQDNTTDAIELTLDPAGYVYQQFKAEPLNLTQAVKVVKTKIKSGTVSGKLWLDDVSLSVAAPEALLPLP